jgi:hypothetical protein
MARSVFYSFYYKEDVRRVSQVRQMGALEGQPMLNSNEWEKIERGGDPEIRAWIARQMKGKKCLVVLIGANTAGRKWVKYEIEKAWNDGLGVVGIHIHGLNDPLTGQSTKGRNPVPSTPVGSSQTALSSTVQVHDTPYTSGDYVYGHIKAHLTEWVDSAIAQRARY